MDPSKTKIILGPPGTGKTTELLNIAESELAAGANPKRIAFITFTKKAAHEGITRGIDRFLLAFEDLPYFKTLHALSFRQLGIHRDQVVQWTHLKELGKILGLDFKGKTAADDGTTYGMNTADRMLFLEGLARTSMVTLREAWNTAMEDEIDWWELERFGKAFRAFKSNRGLLDYTDMLENYLGADQSAFPSLDLLLVDEAQDLSKIQWRLIDRLAGSALRVVVAGDDDQAIYKWSGADVEEFISLQGEIKVLDKSHRVPESVHLLAQGISGRISRRRPKAWTSRKEGGAVNWQTEVEEIDISSGTWLLLARNGYMLNSLEDSCMRQGFSFTSVNRNPLKSPALRAIKTWEELRRGEKVSAGNAADAVKYLSPAGISKQGAAKLRSNDQEEKVSMQVLKDKYSLMTDTIWHTALTRISPSERDFFIAARKRGESLLKEPRIRISTIHAAKGSEADHVVLLTDMSHRCYQNMLANPDDEARVFYVGATRCKKTLNIVTPRTNLNFEV